MSIMQYLNVGLICRAFQLFQEVVKIHLVFSIIWIIKSYGSVPESTAVRHPIIIETPAAQHTGASP
jgi:hypothetical protein